VPASRHAPGDVVALESPTFFGYLDLIESLGLRVLEIPTHPATGLSLPALELALDTQPVRAVLAAPTLSNPLGSVMPLAAKQKLVKLLAQRGVPLIEDVVFNDLLAGDERRKAAKSFDTDGGAMVCGSFAKTLTPGIRLGWVEAGRWRDSVASASACRARRQGARKLRPVDPGQSRPPAAPHMNQRRNEARRLIAHHFPAGTRVSNPPSGDTLWLELEPGFSSMELFRRCAAEGITFGPGEFFTATDRYRHCLRLNFSGAWNTLHMQALARIGEIAANDASPPGTPRAWVTVSASLAATMAGP
jgi:DNA-binding transcriptional MocR family regulator